MTETLAAERALPVGPVDRKAAGWWGMLTLIATEAAVFAYLLFSYYYVAVQPHPAWPPSGAPSLRLALPNTAILILSSVTFWRAEEEARAGRRARLLLWLLATIVLGAAFVGIQLVEWSGKPFGFSTDVYASLYFTITGFHMAHVAAGLLIAAALLLWSALGYFGPGRMAPIAIGAIYWHFVDAVWLTVFFTFYITPYLA